MSQRPPFMEILGLLPPITTEDIKKAYLDKVKHAHPDRGGAREDFEAIQTAYAEANEYLSYRSDRKAWISSRADAYLATRNLVEKLEQLGATVTMSDVTDLDQSFGDFAILDAHIASIDLTGAAADQAIDMLVRERAALRGLQSISLAGRPISDAAVLQLRVFDSLMHLDISNTMVSNAGAAVAEWLPNLSSLDMRGSRVSWWTRYRTEAMLRRRRRKHRGLKATLQYQRDLSRLRQQ